MTRKRARIFVNKGYFAADLGNYAYGMAAFPRTAVLVLLFVAALPFGSLADELVPGKLVPKVLATSDFSYALYLPKGYNVKQKWPVIFVLDPLARGSLAAEKFVPGAERYGYIVAASNDSRNGPLRSDAIGAMWDDVRTRFSIDPKRLYLAGMSGGARAAVTVAERCDACAVAGVIICAAGFADSKYSPSKRLAFYGIAGIYDFNYPELQRSMEKLESLQITHRFQSWQGKHEWAPAPVLEDALAWFRLQAMVRGTIPRDTAFLDASYDRQMKEAGELAASGGNLQSLSRIQADRRRLRFAA